MAKGDTGRRQNVTNAAQTSYNQLQSGPTPLEKEFTPISQGFYNNYQTGMGRQMQDYGDIMGQYNQFRQGLGSPTKFGYQNVNARRPGELNEAYGTMRQAIPGYQEFAQTGGYSPTDIQELRARGISPIRAAYGNNMMELDRMKSVGGGYSPGYTAAVSKMQSELPGQMADAMTGVNANLAQQIREGRLQGLAGLRGIGGDIGQLSSAEAGRGLQASLANQEMNMRAQLAGEESLQNLRANQLRGIGGQAQLYGTTPAMASTFGNQALQAYNMRNEQQQLRNQFGLGLLDAQLRSIPPPGKPWWQSALELGGTVALGGLPLGGFGGGGNSGGGIGPAQTGGWPGE